jgi:hypothetical protein
MEQVMALTQKQFARRAHPGVTSEAGNVSVLLTHDRCSVAVNALNHDFPFDPVRYGKQKIRLTLAAPEGEDASDVILIMTTCSEGEGAKQKKVGWHVEHWDGNALTRAFDVPIAAQIPLGTKRIIALEHSTETALPTATELRHDGMLTHENRLDVKAPLRGLVR